MTTPLRTALDLGRLRHRDQALAALDAFLHLGLVTHEELARLPRPVRRAAGRRPAALARLDRRRARRVGRRVGATAALVRRGPATAAAADLHPQERRRGVPARPGPRGAAVRRGVRRGRLPHVEASSAATTTVAAPCSASGCAGSSRSSTTPACTGSSRTLPPGCAAPTWAPGPPWASAPSSSERPICADSARTTVAHLRRLGPSARPICADSATGGWGSCRSTPPVSPGARPGRPARRGPGRASGR